MELMLSKDEEYLKSIDANGLLTFGSRIRRLNDLLVKQVVELYSKNNINFKPHWFPIILALKQQGTLDIKSLSQRLKTSHSSASQLVKELAHNKLIKVEKEKNDLRQRNISLTEQGHKIIEAQVPHLRHITSVFSKVIGEDADLILRALEKFEIEMRKESLLERSEADIKANNDVEIVEYNEMLRYAFYQLNKDYITKYFEMEPKDILCLEDPQGQILDKGGQIFIAVKNMLPIGTVAILHQSKERVELAKIIVDEQMQGRGIGQMLMQKVVDYCRLSGYKEIYLEANSILKSAISLYRKYGFIDLPKQKSEYKRADMFMLMSLVAE